MIRLHRAGALVALIWLAACATSPSFPPSPHDAVRSVLLVSLDGVHPDYLGRGDTPRLDRLARAGVRAEWMRPSYPSLTFPNHYTIVTGLRPDRHGIVHNTMHDDDLGRFRLADRDAVGDGRWWGGEPLWVTAERAGLATATLSWPGSEAPVRGVRPARWHAFDHTRPVDTRVDMVVEWLDAPAARRPRFATLYFEHPDSAGHAHGPDSPQLRKTMRMIDAAIGRLVDGLEAAGVRDEVDLVIVSDHGMAEVVDGHVVLVEDMVTPALASMVTSGQVVGFRPVAGRTAEAEQALLGRHSHYQCWRRDAMPARWHYGLHPRVPPIVCQMDVGWDALPREHAARRPAGTRGSHGFDPDAPQMRAIFIANGPSFRRGATLHGFDNVDVYPLLARLVGVPPVPNDGDPDTLLPALRDPPTRRADRKDHPAH
ncbi:ectonucleotide pyrophosphatase/phosphodiesterase [Luteimonas kalidii]|uniref:Ectonucleotide pyrophosphatase/phosphodiesterase n=1 Tax=Luteimonas kalidii TaxID=3042025 RepID=A0ABT6JQ20_9GAMM|nr:ectonucleotide pyrophosphatase/phosphodiesterase [Luteimonas kalidii]MDH5832602.1 ectonucleotide pyrophosphatase/phosphodiesterase [Luteimonas kalidii]